MNNLTNYHSHCSFCDGRAPLETFIQAAISQGFTSYGISSHAPLPFSTRWTLEKEQVTPYLQEANSLKQKYAGEIELYIGMEIDYLNAESNPATDYFRELPLDYRIGSVHLLESLTGEIVDVDVSEERFKELLSLHFGNDLQQTVYAYFEKNIKMIKTGGFDILGHPDKMAYNASRCQPGLLEQKWYQDLIYDYFSLIARHGLMMEINTKAYHRLGTFFPHVSHFPLIKELGIPVMVNSDAHFPELINSGRPEALAALQKAGIREVMELHHTKWELCPIRG